MKVLVLGATGLLGSNLVRALLAKGDQVRALIRPTNPAKTLAGATTDQAATLISPENGMICVQVEWLKG